MTVTRTFDAWSTANGRATVLPLSILKDAALGIDAEHYLRKTFGPESTFKEPLLNALGGHPNCFKNVIEQDIDRFIEQSIKPVFVFSGCSISRTEKPFSVPDNSVSARNRAWELYEKKQPREAVEAFGQTGLPNLAETFRSMMRLLEDKGIEFQVAPYASWPQLAYLESRGYVDAIYGPSELFLFNVEKVIVNFNLSTNQFTFTSKERLRGEVNLSNDQFIDACLLSGSQVSRTFPPLEANSGDGLFQGAVTLVKRYRSVGAAINSNPDQRTGYLDRFHKARAAIKYHVIMHEDGKVEQLEMHDSPHDVHKFIGQRLPEELYFYLSRGVCGSQVPEMLTTGEFIQNAPLDCNDSDEFKRFLGILNIMRTESLSLLSKSLHRYWNTRDVKVYNWFDPNTPEVLSHKDIPHPSEVAQKWNVRESLFGPVMNDQPQWGELAFCITSLRDEEFAAKTITPKKPDQLLETQEEIRINTIWRMLQMRQYIDGETHKLTAWGRALAAGITSVDTEDESMITAQFVAIELYRMGLLHGEKTLSSFSGDPTVGSEIDVKYSTLIARVCSLMRLEVNPVPYDGPLSRSILAFSSFSHLLTKELRNYEEMTLVNLLMAGDANREDRNDWSALALRLPFVDDVPATLGVVAKVYLDALNGEDDPTSDEAKERQQEKLVAAFPQATDVYLDLEVAFMMFGTVEAAVKSLASEGIMVEGAKVFEEANSWLLARR